MQSFELNYAYIIVIFTDYSGVSIAIPFVLRMINNYFDISKLTIFSMEFSSIDTIY